MLSRRPGASDAVNNCDVLFGLVPVRPASRAGNRSRPRRRCFTLPASYLCVSARVSRRCVLRQYVCRVSALIGHGNARHERPCARSGSLYPRLQRPPPGAVHRATKYRLPHDAGGDGLFRTRHGVWSAHALSQPRLSCERYVCTRQRHLHVLLCICSCNGGEVNTASRPVLSPFSGACGDVHSCGAVSKKIVLHAHRSCVSGSFSRWIPINPRGSVS